MDWDEPQKQSLSAVSTGADLKTLSLAELEARIAVLNAEIERVKLEIAAKKKHEALAGALFKK